MLRSDFQRRVAVIIAICLFVTCGIAALPSLVFSEEEEVANRFSINTQFTVSPGTPKYIIFSGNTDGLKVTLIPGGNTALCEETSSPQADIRAGTATYIPWTKGSVTVDTTDNFFGAATGYRFTATGGDITVELVKMPQ